MALQSQIDKLIDLDKIVSELTTDKVLKVGWPEKIRYPEEQGGRYVAEIAAQNEYGAPHKHIPPRPFMGPAIAQNKTKWLNIFFNGAKKVVKDQGSILQAFNKVGAAAAGDVSKAIKAVTAPPLSPVTIAHRLSKLKRKRVTASLTKPLVDTGIMLRAVTYAVEDE